MSKTNRYLEEAIGTAVLGQYLTEWNTNMSYKQVLEQLYKDATKGANAEDDIVMWEPYEYWAAPYLAEIIKDVVDAAVEAAEEAYKS